MLRVTWVKSTIGHKAGARGTIRALGLHRLNQSVEIPDTPVNRGMIRRVAFLLDVQEPDEAKLAKIKAEGLAFVPGHPERAWIAIDPDDVDVPARLYEIELVGSW